MSEEITKISVALAPLDIKIIDNLAEKKGLGRRGFSAALRIIVREWAENRFQRRSGENDCADKAPKKE